MTQKEHERIYAEKAAELLSADWDIVTIAEPPDFEVRTDNENFGLEITQIFIDEETKKGSPSREKEFLNRQLVSKIAKAYYAADGPPIAVTFLGHISPSITTTLVAEMLAEAPSSPDHEKDIVVDGIKVFMRATPIHKYSRWKYLKDNVGWVRIISSEDLQYVIDKKAKKLPVYKEKYDDIDLLIVADRFSNSGKLEVNEDLSVSNPGFRAIYFMPFPLGIQKVA